MTLVIKRINNQDYHYYQDRIIRAKGGETTVSTYVGRANFGRNLKKSEHVKPKALAKHIANIISIAKIRSDLKFENRPSKPYDDTKLLEKLRFLYDHIAKNIPPDQLKDIRRSLFAVYVHGTTAIEGNTLNQGETEKLLFADKTPANKSVNEILEVSNYKEAQAFIDRYNGDVDLAFIKRIHSLLMYGIRDHDGKLIDAGNFRAHQVRVAGASFTPSPPEKIEVHLSDVISDFYKGLKRNINPIELTSIYHHKFETVHPFTDGNGRTGRAILNFMLTQSGFPAVYILPKDRNEYLRVLEEGNFKNYVPLIDFVIARIIASLVAFYSKTDAYYMFRLPETLEIFAKISAEKIYNHIVKEINRYHDKEEFP